MSVDEIVAALDATPKAGGWRAACPCKDHKSNGSAKPGDGPLSIKESDDGKPLFHCHAGCTQEEIIAELRRRDLWNGWDRDPTRAFKKAAAKKTAIKEVMPVPPDAPLPAMKLKIGEPSCFWSYRDDQGNILLHVARYETGKDSKTIRAWCWNGSGWTCTHPPTPTPLYGLDRLAARRNAPVLVVEGEKTAEAAAPLLPDFVVVTWMGGAEKASKAHWAPLQDRRVVIWPDNDSPGAKAARAVEQCARLIGAETVAIVTLPAGLKDGWDLADDVPASVTLDPVALVQEALTRAAVVAKAASPSQEAAGTGVPPSEEEAPNLTETGNALRFVRRSRGRVVWLEAWNAWLLYDGKRWCKDTTLRAPALMAETCRALYQEAGAKEEKEERKAVSAWAIKSESRKIQGNALDLAKQHVAVEADVFDQNQWQLNVQNGTLNLRNGQLRPHAAADMIMKLAPVEYLPDAKCPLWEQFLAHVLGGDSELIAWVQRFVGYSLTGNTTEHVLALLYGSGRNGKTTFLETLGVMVGDYATIIAFRTLAHRDERGGDARPDLMKLRGARLVTAAESGEGSRLNEDLIKQLTGGDRIAARGLYQDTTTFPAAFKLMIATNHKPTIRGNDFAIWERVKLVPFEVTIPRDKRDKDLREKLLAELPGILAWAVRGCLEWQSVGLGEAQKIETATKEYREEQDSVGQFINEQCVVGPDHHQPPGDLLKTYNEWAGKNGAPTLKPKDFGGRLTARGFRSGTKRINGVMTRIWTGLALRADRAGDVF